MNSSPQNEIEFIYFNDNKSMPIDDVIKLVDMLGYDLLDFGRTPSDDHWERFVLLRKKRSSAKIP